MLLAGEGFLLTVCLMSDHIPISCCFIAMDFQSQECSTERVSQKDPCKKVELQEVSTLSDAIFGSKTHLAIEKLDETSEGVNLKA